MTINKNGFNFEIVQHGQHFDGLSWINKQVVSITPETQTWYDLQDNGNLNEYPQYKYYPSDDSLEEIVEDITAY